MLKTLLKNTTVQTLGKIVTILISLVTTATLTRKLGVHDYGLFTLTTSIFLLVDSVADFGTRVIGVREAAGATNEEEKLKVWVNTIVLRKVLTAGAFVLGVAVTIFYSGFEGFRWWALVALSMSWFTSVAGDEEIIFQTEARLDLKTVIDVLYPLGFLILMLIFGDRLQLGWVFGGYLVSRIISLLVGVRLINLQSSIFNLQFKKYIDWKFVKRMLIESWPMGVYMLVFTSYDRAVDSTMIRQFGNEVMVAQYGLAYKIYTNLVMPAYFLVSSVFPIMSKNEDKSATKKTLAVAGIMVLGIVPMVWLLAPWMVSVLAGSGYEAAAGILRILLAALVFAYFGHVLGFRLISQGGQKAMLQLGVIALVINIGLNWALIPRFGMAAAAWVTVITEGVMTVFSGWKLWKEASIKT